MKRDDMLNQSSHRSSASALSRLCTLFQAPPDYFERIFLGNQQNDTTSTRNIKFKEFFQFRCAPGWIAAGVGGAATLTMLTAAAVRWKRLRLPLAVTVGSAGMGSALYTTMIEPRRPVLERVTLHLPSLPPDLAGLRIGHISDFHLGFLHTRANTMWAVRQMQEEVPDLLVLTGDFVSFERAIPTLPELFAPLTAPLGVYAVPGNHDHWEGLDAIRAHLEPLGITFLMNVNRRLRWRGASFWLAGVDDMWYGQPDLDAALEGIPHDAFTILLAHPPDYADIATERAIALQISGHTHGGHMQLPKLGWFCVPYHGFRYISGLEQVGTMHLYITRGVGGMPVRLNCRPEATILTLQPA